MFARDMVSTISIVIIIIIIIVVVVIITNIIIITIRSSVYSFDMVETTATIEVILLDLSELLTGVRALPKGGDSLKLLSIKDDVVSFSDFIDILEHFGFMKQQTPGNPPSVN